MLTKEQNDIVEFICDSSNDNDNKIIAVNAIAGSGKTSTCNAIIGAFRPINGFYTAFNKAIIEDSKSKFGNFINCKTVHALAYKYVNIPNKRNIKELTYNDIKERLDYDSKIFIINELDNFYRSKYLVIDEYLEVLDAESYLKSLIVEYMDKMLNGKIAPTFNFLLKCLHFDLANGMDLDFDLFILDEAQDTTAVTLEIFKLINAQKKVVLGDKYQNIYSFMNTINAFDKLENTINFKLTKSFRCNEYIASQVEDYGKRFLEENFVYKGHTIADNKISFTYLSRTNATLIKRMHQLMYENKSFTTIRSLNELFALPNAIYYASIGYTVYDNKYKFLEKEYKEYKENFKKQMSFFSYLKEIFSGDKAILSNISLLEYFRSRNVNILEFQSKVQDMKANGNIILSTAHSFKGLESDTVFIEDDLNNCISEIKETLHNHPEMSLEEARKTLFLDNDIEDMNVYYVALSRARTKLYNVEY